MTKSKSRSFKDLEVGKLSIDLARRLGNLTSKFPASENFGLTNQMRRAAVAIPSNIAEAQGRNSAKEFKQFPAINLGSIVELEPPTDTCQRNRITDPGGFKSVSGHP
jgi:four helix bundle protein